MAMYKFCVRFSGLCGYVPRGRSEKNPSRVDVLLVKENHNPVVASMAAYRSYERKEHSPVLKFKIANLGGENGELGGADGLWTLDNEEIRFSIVERVGSDEKDLDRGLKIKTMGHREGSEAPFEDDSIDDPVQRKRDYEDQLTDLYWLPEMKKVLAGAGDVNPECLGEDPTSFVSARFILEEGVLRTEALGMYKDKFVVAQFAPASEGVTPSLQAVAHWVVWEVEIDERFDVLIRARTFSDSSEGTERTLRLRPTQRDDGQELKLNVTVSNLCCGYYLSEGIEEQVPSVDDDFVYIYNLCALFDEFPRKFYHLPVPVPVKFEFERRVETSRASGGVDAIKCTGGRFNFVKL